VNYDASAAGAPSRFESQIGPPGEGADRSPERLAENPVPVRLLAAREAASTSSPVGGVEYQAGRIAAARGLDPVMLHDC